MATAAAPYQGSTDTAAVPASWAGRHQQQGAHLVVGVVCVACPLAAGVAISCGVARLDAVILCAPLVQRVPHRQVLIAYRHAAAVGIKQSPHRAQPH